MILIVKAIKLRLESPNKTNNKMFGYENYKRRIFKDAGLQMNPSPAEKPGEKRKVTVIYRHTGKRPFDDDNLRGACKPLFDLLVKKNFLSDDAEKWCEREYRQETNAAENEVVIIIESIEQ